RPPGPAILALIFRPPQGGAAAGAYGSAGRGDEQPGAAGGPFHAENPPAASRMELAVRVHGLDCDWHVQHLGDRRLDDCFPAVTSDGRQGPTGRAPAPCGSPAVGWPLNSRRARPPTAGWSRTMARASRFWAS